MGVKELFRKARWLISSNEEKLQVLKKKGLTIGDNCEILNGYDFGSEPYLVQIGNHVRIASGVRITTHDGGMWVLRGMDPAIKDADVFARVVIGNNCHIGTDAILMPGVSIGDNCIIGANAVVTHDIPSNSVAVGVPARVIESVDEYRTKNESLIVLTKGMSWKKKREYLSRRGY